VTSDVECNPDPRSNTGEDNLASCMPWPEALNEKSAITDWAAEAKSKRDGDALTDDEDWKRNSNEPRPAEHEDSDHAEETNGEPATRPDYEPRLNV
jgi:hypothetical protein